MLQPKTWGSQIENKTKLLFVEFWCGIKEEYPQLSEKVVYVLHICVRLDFFHLLQPKEYIATDWMQRKL